VRQRWFSRRALGLHLAILVWAPGCAVAAWWQVTIAMAGNGLAYLYAVEWPVFALLGIVVWWNLIHDDPEEVGTRALRRARRAAEVAAAPPMVRRPEEEDEELAAYNAYLAALAEEDRARARRSS
jgi:hypothetical protein